MLARAVQGRRQRSWRHARRPASGEQPAAEVVAAIQAAGGEALIDGGRSRGNAAHKMIEAAVNRFSRIDIVVNNAGILRDAMSPHERTRVRRRVGVHLKGCLNVSRAAAPHFKRRAAVSSCT